jgi:hypothetical protein
MDFDLLKDAVLTLLNGRNPYVGLTNFPGPHNYPPTAFWFLIFLPDRFWFDGLSALAFFAAVFLLTGRNWLLSLFLFLVFSLVFFPYKFNAGMGQINNFILFLTVLAYYFHPFFLSYAIGIKLTPAIFLLYYFLSRQFDKIFLVLLGLGVLFGLSFWLIGWEFQKVYFLDVFWRAWGMAGKEVYYNQSLAGLLARAGWGEGFPALAVLFLVLTMWRGHQLSPDRLFAAAACLMLMLNPLAWQHHFVMAVIPLILLFPLNKILVLTAFFLLAWNFKTPQTVPKELLSHQFYGVFILWVLALWGKNAAKILGFAGVLAVTAIYVRFLLCRGFVCF